eukprot:UN01874
MSLLCVCALIIGIKSELRLEQSPMELHPEIVARVRKMSDCTDDQMELIHKNCSSLVQQLIHLVDQYENLPRSRNYGMIAMSECERAQIACFSHKLWMDSSKCACSICNHIWFYDDRMHEHFVTYFEQHDCEGVIPNQMDNIQFCHFMNQTERTIVPQSCQNHTHIGDKIKQKHQNKHDLDLIDYLTNTSNILYTNHITIIWTVLLAITMSLSLYFWIY